MSQNSGAAAVTGYMFLVALLVEDAMEEFEEGPDSELTHANVPEVVGPHPFVEATVAMDPDVRAILLEGTHEHGPLGEVVVDRDGLVIDGWQNYLVCQEVGVKPHVVLYAGDDPLRFRIRRNHGRRHLTKSQTAWEAALYRNFAERSVPQRERAELFGCSDRMVSMADVVMDDGQPHEHEQVASGTYALNIVYNGVKSRKDDEHLARIVAKRRQAASSEAVERSDAVTGEATPGNGAEAIDVSGRSVAAKQQVVENEGQANDGPAHLISLPADVAPISFAELLADAAPYPAGVGDVRVDEIGEAAGDEDDVPEETDAETQLIPEAAPEQHHASQDGNGAVLRLSSRAPETFGAFAHDALALLGTVRTLEAVVAMLSEVRASLA